MEGVGQQQGEGTLQEKETGRIGCYCIEVVIYLAMTRYALARSTSDGLQYLAAAYGNSGDGIVYTQMRTNAGLYITIEKAIDVCRSLRQNSYSDLFVVPVEGV